MPWWIWVLINIVGGLTMLRILMLWAKGNAERRSDNCPRCKDEARWCKQCNDENGVDLLGVGFGTFFWPFPLAYMVIGKIMFPRGMVTRYAKEKAARAEAIDAARRDRERAEAIEQFCRNNNLPVPMFLKEMDSDG